MKISLDVTDTSVGNVRTGIQRVARKIVENLLNLGAAAEEITFYPIEIVSKNSSVPAFWRENDYRVQNGDLLSRDKFNGPGRILHGAWTQVRDSSKLGKFVRMIHLERFAIWIARYFTSKPSRSSALPRFTPDYHLVMDAFWNRPDSVRYAKRLQKKGSRIGFICFDLLPYDFPEFFEESLVSDFKKHMKQIVDFADDVWCISAHTKKRFEEIFPEKAQVLNVDIFDLGFDFANAPLKPLKSKTIGSLRPTGIMIGTIEPRKNHELVLDWFEQHGSDDFQLVIVGKAGWKSENIQKRLEHLEVRTYGAVRWLPSADDSELAHQIGKADFGIVASHGEGYGLPLAEMLSFGIPVVASEIDVFREVAGDSASYFDATNANDLNRAIISVLNRTQDYSPIEFTTWAQSSKELMNKIVSVMRT